MKRMLTTNKTITINAPQIGEGKIKVVAYVIKSDAEG
jgi:hypothetical protein